MPGRQYTQQGVDKKSKPRRTQKKRLLNAFSIATHDAPERVKIRKNRLGEAEQAVIKRRRDDSDAEDDSDERNGPTQKRVKSVRQNDRGDEVESGHDSDGNDWVTGEVPSDDDSSIDSDEAFGESDEEKPGLSKWRAGSNKKAGHTRGRQETIDADNVGSEDGFDLKEDEEEFASFGEYEDSEAESEGFAAEAIDLADVLDQRDSESEDEAYIPPLRDADYGEIPERELDELSNSDDEDEAQDMDKLNAIQDLVSSLGTGKESAGAKDFSRDAQELAAPSDYGVSTANKLTIADLLPTVTDPKLRKSLRSLADDGKRQKNGAIPQKLDVPLAKRQQDRIDRAAAFEKSKEALSRWIDTVKHNRRVEHLQFPLPDPDSTSAKNTKRLRATTYSKPMTDLESTIQDILVQSGLVSSNGKSEESKIQEFEELATNKLPIEEVQARRAELRRTRELLFREEIKAKRIKKIKSKAYRRVHRKERERNAQREHEAAVAAGHEPSEDEQERMHRQRAEERMGAKHRESKWAKGVKSTGRAAWDDDARTGITEMARREDELKRRIQGKDVNGNDSIGSESESSSDDSEDEDNWTARMQGKLQNIKGDEGPGKGLASLKFMQNAEAARKARNDEAIIQMEKELAGGSISDEDEASEEEAPGRRAYGATQKVALPVATVSRQRNEFEEGLDSDDEQATHQQGIDKDAVKGSASTKPGGRRQNQSKLSSQQPQAQPARLFDTPATGDSSNLWLNSANEKQHKKASELPAAEESTNPWTAQPKRSSKRQVTAAAVTVVTNSEPDPQPRTKRAAPMKSSASNRKPQDKAGPTQADPEDDSDSDSPSALNAMTKKTSLMEQAFASDADFTTTSFATEKSALAEEEAPQDIKSDILPGWGSWVGEGLSRATLKANRRQAAFHAAKNAGKNQKIEGVVASRRKDAKLDKVIISQKRTPNTVKYLASTLPHQFETKEQYERSLRLPMGKEWSTQDTFQTQTKPRVLMKGGIIAPIRKPLA